MLSHLIRSLVHHAARQGAQHAARHATHHVARQVIQNAAQQAVNNPITAASTVIGAANLGMKAHEQLAKKKKDNQ